MKPFRLYTQTPPWIFSTLFLALLVLLLYQLFLVFRPFIMPILWAVILVRLAYPVYRWAFRRLHSRKNLAAAVLTVAVLLLAVAPAAYLIFALVEETLSAYENVAEWLRGGGLSRAAEYISHLPVVGKYSQEWLGRFIVFHKQFESSIIEGGKVITTFMLTQAAEVAKNAVVIIIDFLIMLFTLFFLFRDGDWLFERVYRAIPLNHLHKAKLLNRIQMTLSAVIRGTVLTAFGQGVGAGLAYWLLDVPFPVFLGAVSGVLSLVPFGGTFFVWGPVSVYLFVTGPAWKGVTMIAIGGGLVGLMDNFLQPLLTGTAAKLPMLFLFFASVGGLAYFGFIGLFLGPILLAIVIAAFQIYEEEYQEVHLPVPATVEKRKEAG